MSEEREVRSERNGHSRSAIRDRSSLTIPHSPFAIRHSPFLPLAARRSLLAVFRGSPFLTTKRSRRKIDVSKFVRDP
jgi:hypothetical protein